MFGVDALETAGPTVVWLIVVTFVFLECAFIIGLFLPGDSLLITAGIVLAAHEAGTTHVWTLSAGAMAAAIAGNQVGYMIGQRTGSKLHARRNARYLNAENLHKVNVLLDRHGFFAVLVARWIPWVRTLCPLVAGAAKMDPRKYTIASTLGAIVWAPVLLLLGFYAGTVIERIEWLLPVVIGTLLAMLVVGTVLGVRHYLQEMANPEEDALIDELHDHPHTA